MANNYYRLNDLDHLGLIVRTDGPIEHKYVTGMGWVKTGLMIHYFCDESDRYDMYTELSEEEALAAIKGMEA